MKDLFDSIIAADEQERGQILVILAAAMIGLLVAAGLAVDGGVLFMRKAQLDRAVDAAALTGVTRLTSSNDPAQALLAANTRGQQLLAANGIVTTNAAACPPEDPSDPGYDPTFWDTHDYCGEARPGAIPGSIRYHVRVRWRSEVYFMGLIGFDTIPLYAVATAEYMPMVDIYASDTAEFGLVQTSNEAVFGPDSCSGFGDAYTPIYSPWHADLGGVYTYRIRIPRSYVYTGMGTINHDRLRVEIYDPDTRNTPTNTHMVYNLDGSASSQSCSGGASNRSNPCLLATVDTDDNPFWFVKTDENRYGDPSSNGGCYTPSYTASYNTRTLYRLYYLEQAADGSLHEVDLAYYIGKNDDSSQPVLPSSPYNAAQAAAEAVATDMNWVSPGAPAAERMPAFTYDDVFEDGNMATFSVAEPATLTENCDAYRAAFPAHTSATRCEGNGDFIVTLAGGGNETPGIYIDPSTNNRDLYLQVRALSGASENGFEFWAGPPRTDDPADHEYTVPSFINARQIYIQRARSVDDDIHRSNGVGIFGIGHLPMNSNINYRSDIPLAYLGPEFSGQQMTVELFDADAGATPPVSFFFDTIPMEDWTACYDDDPGGSHCDDVGGQSGHRLGPDNVPNNDNWATYTFTIPSESADYDSSIPFYGGRLFVSYVGGQDDTFGWKMVIESRPFLVE